MQVINNIFKERLTDKLSLKERFKTKHIFTLDNINYCKSVKQIQNNKIKYTFFYFNNHYVHRDDDEFGNPLPAILWPDGNKSYYKHGKRI